MALDPSSLSTMCNSVATLIRTGIDAAANNVEVLVGAPAEAASNDQQTVNLFFYRFEPFGFDSDGQPDEPWMIRLHCLITAFGQLEDQIEAGEHELRMLGEVMRLFHEVPVMPVVDVSGEETRLQAVFNPLTSDELNHIWSTQDAVSFRPSVSYEFAVGPIVPSTRRVGAPLVGATGSEVFASMGTPPGSVDASVETPPVAARTVNVTAPDWEPYICFFQNGECDQALWFEADGPDVTGFTPSVWVAGDPAATVTLRWEVWTSAQGWRPEGPTLDTNPVTLGIDPEVGPPSSVTLSTIALPFDDVPGQVVLYAVRTYTSEVDGSPRTVRSNPLLVTLY